jgi:HEAT repeat protein
VTAGADADAARARASTDRLADEGYDGPQGLVRALEDESLAVRSEAAFVLGMNGAEEAEPALRRALEDESARVRVEAALALARLGRRDEGMAVLREELGGRFFADAPLRAARALALLGDPSGWPCLLEALSSELPSNRMEAIAALPAFLPFNGHEVDGRTIDVRAQLERATEDQEELLRRDALAALEALDPR